MMEIPLNVKGATFTVTLDDIAQWQETFPAVDVLGELRKCRQWNIDHVKRRKTKAGIRGHISGWLGKEQDKAGSNLGREPTRQQQQLRPKAYTVSQELAQQRDEGAKRLKAKYGIGGETDGQSAIPGSDSGYAGSLELGASGRAALTSNA